MYDDDDDDDDDEKANFNTHLSIRLALEGH